MYCALSIVRDTHRKVNELAKTCDDSMQCNTATEQLYGGSRYHAANHEEYGFDCNSVEYIPFQDLLKAFKANATCAVKMLQSQTSIVKADLIDNNDDNEELKRKLKYQKGHFCTDECVLPFKWGTYLHQSLMNLTRTELTAVENLANLQSEILNFDNCSYCKSTNYKECALGNSCRDKLRLLRKLSPHFAGIRTLLRKIYRVREINRKLLEADAILFNNNFEALRKLLDAKQKSSSLKQESVVDNEEAVTNTDDYVLQKFGRLWQAFTDSCLNFPKEYCSICKVWTIKKKLKTFSTFDEIPGYLHTNTNRIVNHFQTSNIELPVKLCDKCCKSLATGKLPELSELNNMGLDPVPEEIACLNMFELMLIKLAKTFQTIVRLQPLSVVKTTGDWVHAVKGVTAHLPLPLQATHTYIQEKLPSVENVEIIVDSCPNKKNLIWRSLVNLDKVYNALNKMKQINPLYTMM